MSNIDNLALLIKEARKIKSKKINQKYTQKLLAKDLDKSQGYIGDLESGRTSPSIKILNDIAKACDVPISFFTEYNDIDESLKKYIKNQLPETSNNDLKLMIAEIKNDSAITLADIFYNNDLDISNNNTILVNTVLDFLNKDIIKDSCNINTYNFDQKKLNNIVHDIIEQVKLVSYKYKNY